MKLSVLYEYFVTHPAAYSFYGDPKGKKMPSGTSFLVGGSADRNRYLGKMGLAKNKKKKKKKKRDE